MDLLRGNFLVNVKEEAVMANEIVREADCVGLYFSASWCPPCQAFLPLLKRAHEESRERGVNLEIIFVPSDRDDQEMARHFVENHGAWYAVPVGELASALRRKMKIYSIPRLVVMSNKGKVITRSGREELESGLDALALWCPKRSNSTEENQ